MLFLFSVFAGVALSQIYGSSNPSVVPVASVNLTGGAVRSPHNCSDLSNGLFDDCWAELKIRSYLRDWINGTICGREEGFADCFLRQHGWPGLSCADVSEGSCPPIQGYSKMDVRPFYVAVNIQRESRHLFASSNLTECARYQQLFLRLVEGSRVWRCCRRSEGSLSPVCIPNIKERGLESEQCCQRIQLHPHQRAQI